MYAVCEVLVENCAERQKSKQKQKVTEGTLKKTTRNNNNTFSFAIAHSKMNDEKKRGKFKTKPDSAEK